MESQIDKMVSQIDKQLSDLALAIDWVKQNLKGERR